MTQSPVKAFPYSLAFEVQGTGTLRQVVSTAAGQGVPVGLYGPDDRRQTSASADTLHPRVVGPSDRCAQTTSAVADKLPGRAGGMPKPWPG